MRKFGLAKDKDLATMLKEAERLLNGIRQELKPTKEQKSGPPEHESTPSPQGTRRR